MFTEILRCHVYAVCRYHDTTKNKHVLTELSVIIIVYILNETK